LGFDLLIETIGLEKKIDRWLGFWVLGPIRKSKPDAEAFSNSLTLTTGKTLPGNS